MPTDLFFSLGQLWAIGGSGSATQSVEVGWQVYPAHYQGDYAPHLFVYWTADNYGTTGCYNLDCGAFVQVSTTLVAGQQVAASATNGTQVEGTLAFYKDPTYLNWYLFQQNSDGTYTMLGYYPIGLFGSGQLSQYATTLLYGGETILYNPYVGLFQVPMGSGIDPSFSSPPEIGQVAYQRGLKYMGVNGVLADFPSNGTFSDCGYGLANGFGANTSYGATSCWGTWIFFGGPGC